MIVPEGKYVDVGDGLKVHYQAEGSGFPVVFLHGSGPGASGWSNFRRNYPAFAAAGLQAIVVDTLGYGHSSKPDDIDYTLDFLVGKLRRALDGIGISRCAVVGNSHGGAMAIKLALDDPGRVARLVLMAPGGLEEREVYMKMAGIRTMMKVFLAGDLTRDSLRKVFELQLYDRALITDEILDERLEIARFQPQRVLTSMQVPHLAPSLSSLQCPIFALWGMDDQFCPSSGAVTIARACKQTRVMLLSECGHWVMVEKAALFNRLCIDFVREEQEQT
jgi:4,5:9,10-diseco-3-hydroxy-5,9,17-trioxoandrosta-1(10),2-diene-4-oate hydrolase